MSTNPYKASAAEQQEPEPNPRRLGCVIAALGLLAVLLLFFVFAKFFSKGPAPTNLVPPPAPVSPTAGSAQP